MINAREALSLILESVTPVGATTSAIERSAGFVLAEDIVAGENIPSFDNSGMDGYALRSEDLGAVPVTLRVVDEIAAGAVAGSGIGRGEAIAIMTGAIIPAGCDAVVQIEWVEKISKQSIRVLRPVIAGHNIRRAGADIRMNTVLLHKGEVLRPQEIGALASLGIQFIKVYHPPTVALLATGNELVEINKPLPLGKVRNSNIYTLQSLVSALGCEAIGLGIARDNEAELTQKIEEGLKADVLITTGGVSVGKYDLVIETMKKLGVEEKFWKVNIKPGMPFMFGMYGTKPVFGLPGNPVSTYVTFYQFVRKALLKMKGYTTVHIPRLFALLQEPIKKDDGKRHFLRGRVEESEGKLIVLPARTQASNVMTSLTSANCFIVIPEEQESLGAGERVEIELL